jgi:hypothetical protein
MGCKGSRVRIPPPRPKTVEARYFLGAGLFAFVLASLPDRPSAHGDTVLADSTDVAYSQVLRRTRPCNPRSANSIDPNPCAPRLGCGASGPGSDPGRPKARDRKVPGFLPLAKRTQAAVVAAVARQALHLPRPGRRGSGLPSPVLKFAWQRRQTYIFELDISGRIPGSELGLAAVYSAWVWRSFSEASGVAGGEGRRVVMARSIRSARRRDGGAGCPCQPAIVPAFRNTRVNGCTDHPSSSIGLLGKTLELDACADP